MNPAQLLNPKAYAKEQAKAKKRPLSHGPQQTRKPSDARIRQPTFDAHSLLNPKGASNVRDQPQGQASEEADAQNSDYGAGSMIERINNVTERQDAPLRKRTVQAIESDTPDEERKKQKAVSSSFGGSGILMDGIKEAQKHIGPAQGTANELIDLTNDDGHGDDDVQFLRESGNEEVCLGFLHSSANAFRIPHVSQGSMRAVGKDHWPRMVVSFRKESTANKVIDLYDRSQTKFATVEPKSASGLCPILNGEALNKVRLKIHLTARKKNSDDLIGKRISQSMKLEIFVFSPRSKADSLGRFLSQRQLFLQTPVVSMGKEVFNPQVPRDWTPAKLAKPQGTRPPTAIQRTVEEMRRETSDMFDSLAKAEDLPEMEADSSIITSKLMAHQKQALHFLMEHERNDFKSDTTDSPQHSLWKFRPRNNGQPAWYHVITGEEVLKKPVPIQGGILADAMGLGKTLSILALIAETREASKRFRREEPAGETEQNARSTLIVCPKSVLSNWQEQIRAHTVPGKMTSYTYHGTSRLQDLRELGKYDIVLTSYNTAAAEVSENVGRSRALASMNWFRIVLDEAHSIRTQTTQISKACCALNTERRWAVTGTPVQNSLYDLGALMKFLRFYPFDAPMVWAQFIMSPFKMGDVSVIENLQILVGSITLRRMKGTIDLPSREEHRERLEFSEAEHLLYKKFAIFSRTQFHSISQGGTVLKGKAYAHILKSLGRLRAICAHGREMLVDEDLKEIEGDGPSNAIVIDIGDEPGFGDEHDFVSQKQAYETFAMMDDSDVAICESCSRKLSDKKDLGQAEDGAQDTPDETEESDSEQDENHNLICYLTPCFHLICKDCTSKHHGEVAKTMTADSYYTCQYCETYQRFSLFPLRRTALNRFRDERSHSKQTQAARWDESTYSGPHTKVKALIEDLKKSAEESKQLPLGEPPFRSVVFSGWTSYLDLIEYALGMHGLGSTRIDGTMSVKQRSQALHTFNTVPDVTVLLVSIKAGGQGLNFTAANRAYVMEPQFNPGVEQQAVDRVHRIGQTRPVVIKHYIMKGSVEEDILALQKKKEDLARLSLEKKRSRGEEAAERMKLLKGLFK